MKMMHSQAFDGADHFNGDCGNVGVDLAADFDLARIDVCHRQQPLALSSQALAEAVGASFRASSHINNVMTHISCARWDLIENALCIIFDPTRRPASLSPLQINIVELICAERGVTGRIVKPYFQSQLERLLQPLSAACLITHISTLYEEIQSVGEGKADACCVSPC